MIELNNSRSLDIFSKVGSVLAGYQSDYELVAGWQPNAVEQFTVICSRGIPRLFLPPSTSLMRTAMISFLGGRRVLNILPSCVSVAAKVGGPFSRFSSNVSLVSKTGKQCPLRDLISDVLNREDFHIALRASFGRPNAKTVAMAISNSGEVLCYVKLGSEKMTDDLVAYESSILKQFESIDLPIITPALLFSGIWAANRSALITSPLQLEPLEPDARLAHIAADSLASQTMVASVPLTESEYWQRIVEHSNKNSDNKVLAEAISKVERTWGASEFDFGTSHGDWTRANLGTISGSIAAIDWERCNEYSPRGIDIAHFALCEKPPKIFSRSLKISDVAEKVRRYLESAGLSPANAEVLVLFALLEMVIRFDFAENAGIRASDSKFGPALREGLTLWAS